MARIARAFAASVLALVVSAGVATAQTYRIGSSLGLTGYMAANDRAWRDGLEIAVEALNAKGGLLGKKVELFVEDNRSEPQEAVVGYRKMMSNDKVEIFDSGCVSAGNFAAAGAVAKASIPMVLCSILPRRPEEQKWAFSFLPPPRFEIETRYKYLKEKTDIRRIGILHDPSPYALMMKDLAVKLAPDYGLEVVATESYKQDDSDMSVQIGRVNAGAGGAIVKMGLGGSTVTVAKNIRQLGLDKMLLLASLDDGAVFKQGGEALGDRFLFVGLGVQLPESMPPGPAKDAALTYLKLWESKHPGRDPSAGARAWDSVAVIARAAEIAGSLDGAKMRDALEKVNGLQGAASAYNFSADEHNGVTQNPFTIGVARDGKLVAK